MKKEFYNIGVRENKGTLWSLLIFCISFAFVLNCFKPAHAGKEPKERTVEVSYAFVVTGLPEDAGEVRVWVPYPAGSEEQRILGLKVEQSPAPASLNFDKEWGNGILYFEPPSGTKDFSFKMLFTVRRTEVMVDLKGSTSGEIDEETFQRYLQPSKYAVHNKRVERFSRMAVGEKTGVLDRARAIYDFVLENMEYNKSVPGWGRGDVNRVCLAIGEGKKGTGNCTDFHSFFGSLMHYQGIPVIFEMGYPLKPGKSMPEPKEGGYHCWAKFFVPGKGWVPVDISEADKDPSKKDYYFGSICENRVSFSRGRDILLSPPQHAERLNFFGPDPYIEVDGKPFTGFTRTISYEDVP